MPCWTSTMIETKLPKINLDRARRALEGAGYRLIGYDKNAIWEDGAAYIDFIGEDIKGTVFADGRIYHKARRPDAQCNFKQLYAAETIKEASRKFGWQVKTQTKTAGNHIQIKLGRR